MTLNQCRRCWRYNRISYQKFFGQNLLDLGKFGYSWAKLRQHLGKND